MSLLPPTLRSPECADCFSERFFFFQWVSDGFFLRDSYTHMAMPQNASSISMHGRQPHNLEAHNVNTERGEGFVFYLALSHDHAASEARTSLQEEAASTMRVP